MNRRAKLLLVMLASTVALTAAGCTSASPTTTSSSSSKGTTTTVAPPEGSFTAIGLQQSFEAVINKVRPSVVQITTDQGLGSGIVYDTNGDVVTNAHVVQGASRYQVAVGTQTYPASLVGSYAADDLAVVKVSGASGLKPATFGDSSTVQVGEIVLAIGNPLGLSSSVTDGIVSFVGRTVSESQAVTLPNTIQTSAPINPGNSGGALVDMNATVIGIPTLAATDPQLGGGTAPGIGFAIPSNTIKLIAPQLISSGRVTNSGRAALGVRVSQAFDQAGEPVGVFVQSTTGGGAAAKAGVQAGDLITSVNGQPTPTLEALQSQLASLQPGQSIGVGITKPNGKKTTATVTLEQLPGS